MTDTIRSLAREPDILLGRVARTHGDRRENFHLVSREPHIQMDITDIVHGRDVDEYRL